MNSCNRVEKIIFGKLRGINQKIFIDNVFLSNLTNLRIIDLSQMSNYHDKIILKFY
jgi:hypothetical protein